MAYDGLTSHHVNYLIWRYLQESGSFYSHGDAALMLQRAWNHNPQDFPFASYIKPHALIVLIQKGLQYFELEQSLDQAGNPLPLTTVSFFGPVASDSRTPARKPGHGDVKDGTGAETGTRTAPPKPSVGKPTTDGIVNGHANEVVTTPKSGKPGKSASAKDGDVSFYDGETPMEIDQQGMAQERVPQAKASPPAEPVVDADGDVGMRGQNEREPSPPIFTLTVGQSTGVQISPSKAADLGPDTTLFDIGSNSEITQTLWRPDDPTTVTAAGDTFCGLWKLSGPRSAVAPTYEPLVETQGDGTCVTTSSWDSAGKMLAVATYQDPMNGNITMYGHDGTAVDLLPDLPRMVSGLYWAPRGLRMIVVLSDGQHSELTLWDQAVRPDEFPAPQMIDGLVHEVSWCSDEMIYACGDGSVYEYRGVTDLLLNKTYTSNDGQEPWTFIASAMIAGSPVAVTASSSTTNIWVPTHDISVSATHHGDITALELRPQPQSSLFQKSTSLLFATSSMDDTVKLWNINVESKQIQCLHRLYLGASSPALCSRFSPDGYAIAAATHDRLFIWSVERGGVALAKWTAPRTVVDHSDGAGNNSKNVEDLEDAAFYRSLSWDCDGKKLALGFGKQMAIINLQR
ncbi:predicted protein [Histoplasma mississippiense (nom. inval.)]|uniref:predicted protein n=1 Tax=Ajellomyces capsulatus (strain NAm1 / WU24) TaxID=2059318 RepID=UPI000157C508|nr:predicted protein [Histoplasma mississippiense (nom. inval.)]EDN08727.1 predicted protein [Histoplasma mississippiense (nom. inval.)]